MHLLYLFSLLCSEDFNFTYFKVVEHIPNVFYTFSNFSFSFSIYALPEVISSSLILFFPVFNLLYLTIKFLITDHLCQFKNMFTFVIYPNSLIKFFIHSFLWSTFSSIFLNILINYRYFKVLVSYLQYMDHLLVSFKYLFFFWLLVI